MMCLRHSLKIQGDHIITFAKQTHHGERKRASSLITKIVFALADALLSRKGRRTFYGSSSFSYRFLFSSALKIVNIAKNGKNVLHFRPDCAMMILPNKIVYLFKFALPFGKGVLCFAALIFPMNLIKMQIPRMDSGARMLHRSIRFCLATIGVCVFCAAASVAALFTFERKSL